MKADDVGDRGQSRFVLMMTELPTGRKEPYFRPHFLGDKYPTFDYLVELVGEEPYFFFVQVRCTRQGYRKGAGVQRLRVNVSKEDVQRMVASPVPAYVVGIDDLQGDGYLLSVNEPRHAGFGGLPAKHLLNWENMQRLWEEVQAFWASRDMMLTSSYFV